MKKKFLITESEKYNILKQYGLLNEQLMNYLKPKIKPVPFKNAIEGNKFRKWVNKFHPELAKKYDLDSESPYFNNAYITNAYNHYFPNDKETLGDKFQYVITKGQGYEKAMAFDKTNQNQNKEQDSVFQQQLRYWFPNYAQLQNPRPMTSEDFTHYQKSIILDVIKQSIKRKNYTNNGCTEYIDYGTNISDYFNNPKGSPSSQQAIIGTLTSVAFQMATLIGRFCWSKNDKGEYIVTDKYDFKNPGYAELKGATREQLKGKSLEQLKREYNLGDYAATRTKAWVDFPEGTGLPITMTINPQMFVSGRSKFTPDEESKMLGSLKW